VARVRNAADFNEPVKVPMQNERRIGGAGVMQAARAQAAAKFQAAVGGIRA
jgi:hypothetical protein